MTFRRLVTPELLDGLAEDDPAARRSRRDLRRVHRAMGTHAILTRTLHALRVPVAGAAPLRVLELGAGDGTLMLGVARALAPRWRRPVALTLLDRQDLVEHATIAGYRALGWAAKAEVVDVLDWAAGRARPSTGSAFRKPDRWSRWDLIVANLFLHHFETPQLRSLLHAVAARGDGFLACEPRRAWVALAGSHLVGALGVGKVTREDAVTSVHAGFRGQELTALWPAPPKTWQVREFSAGLFSHCFAATRHSSP